MKKRISAFLIALAVLAVAPASAYAAGKSETVYANLSAAGVAEKVYVVNAFDGAATDYGAYSSVKNLTDDTALTFKNGAVEISSAGRFLLSGRPCIRRAALGVWHNRRAQRG